MTKTLKLQKKTSNILSKIKDTKSGLFLWLPVKDDINIAKLLWRDFSIRVMPGSFMAFTINGFNPGKGYLRLALVDQHKIIENAFERITNCLSKINNE